MGLPQGLITKDETAPVEVLRPQLSKRLAWSVRGGPLAGLALAASLLAAYKQGSLVGALLGCAGVALAGLLGTAIYLWWVRIDLTDEALRLRLLKGTRHLERSEVWAVALRDVVVASVTRPVLILYSRDHRCLAILDRRLWSDAVIEALASWAGCSVPAVKTTTNKRLESEFAGSVPAWSRHGGLVGVGVVFAVVALVVLIHAA